jgi:hypothetical protein
MTTTVEPLVTNDDVRTDRRLRTAGLVAIAASVLGSVLVAPPAVSEASSTDRPCRIQIIGDRWYGTGCDDGGAR